MPKPTRNERITRPGGQVEIGLRDQGDKRPLLTDHRAHEGVDDHQEREGAPVGTEAEFELRRSSFRHDTAQRFLAGLQFDRIAFGERSRLVMPHDEAVIWRRRGDPLQERGANSSSGTLSNSTRVRISPSGAWSGHGRSRRDGSCAPAAPRLPGQGEQARRNVQGTGPRRDSSGAASRSGRPTPARNSVSPVKRARSSSR